MRDSTKVQPRGSEGDNQLQGMVSMLHLPRFTVQTSLPNVGLISSRVRSPQLCPGVAYWGDPAAVLGPAGLRPAVTVGRSVSVSCYDADGMSRPDRRGGERLR